MYRWGGGGGGVPSGKPGVGGGGGDDASGGCVERVEVGRRGTQGRRLLGGVCASMVVVRVCGETGQRGAAETDGGRRAEKNPIFNAHPQPWPWRQPTFPPRAACGNENGPPASLAAGEEGRVGGGSGGRPWDGWRSPGEDLWARRRWRAAAATTSKSLTSHAHRLSTTLPSPRPRVRGAFLLHCMCMGHGSLGLPNETVRVASGPSPCAVAELLARCPTFWTSAGDTRTVGNRWLRAG